MKKIYGIMGFTGFIIILGGAGGADGVGIGTLLSVMASGMLLMLLSVLLTKSYEMKMRKRRHLYMKRKAELGRSLAESRTLCSRKTPDGIAQIISGKINSPELC